MRKNVLKLGLLPLVFSLMLFACPGSDDIVTDVVKETVEAPTISPNGGEFGTELLVTLTCNTPEAEICYMLDGTEPNINSTIYSKPFSINANMTVKAMGIKNEYSNSPVATATFTKTLPSTGMIATIMVEGGTFSMGSPTGRANHERPVREITVTNFWMGKYEVTQKQYLDVNGNLDRPSKSTHSRTWSG